MLDGVLELQGPELCLVIDDVDRRLQIGGQRRHRRGHGRPVGMAVLES